MRKTWIDRLRLTGFFRDERGSSTVEFVLWVPGFALLLIVTTDASVLYLTQTTMWNVARDTARKVAIGDITDADAVAEAKSYFTDPTKYTVVTSDPADEEVFVQISVNITDAAVFGKYLGDAINQPLVARVIMRREPV